MKRMVMLAIGMGMLVSSGVAQASHANLPVKSDFALVAPVSRKAVRQMPAVLPFDLTAHAPFDFYPRYRYRGRYYPSTIYVYQPRRYFHPRFGNRIWYRY